VPLQGMTTPVSRDDLDRAPPMAKIPPFDAAGVLPPHLAGPTARHARSPYEATPLDVVERFATSTPRCDILRGYLEYRAALREAGFHEGYQWLDGSFVEDVERMRGRPPNDIDIVTFYRRPRGAPADGSWERSLPLDLLDPRRTKVTFKCDAYYVCLAGDDADVLVDVTSYWFGLFSHRRDTGTWKGMVRVPLAAVDSDREARKILDRSLS
jgi:hypothetical protein